MNYSTQQNFNIFFGIFYSSPSVSEYFQSWDTITSTFAEAAVPALWRNRLNEVMFDRKFDTTTKKAVASPEFLFFKQPADTVNYEIIITSRINYSVNIGSVFTAFSNQFGSGVDNFYYWIEFYDVNDVMLQSVLLENIGTTGNIDRLYGVGDIITNVRSFRIKFQWVDTPPFTTNASYLALREFNLFTQGQEISIPDDASGDRFGFEFVAVEWWNILGHLQNFAWWIVNKSPVAPLFEWIEDYVITWVSGLITFIAGVFRL
jgi:hypothetical protein